MKPLQAGELSIAIETGPGVLRLVWHGRSNHREPGALLAPLFAEALQEASSGKLEVQMHFEKLAQFNSSTIAAVIQFIHGAREKGVAVALIYDGAVKWQALSFEAIRRAMKHFESTGGPSFRITATGQP